jgi:hypothetical protein
MEIGEAVHLFEKLEIKPVYFVHLMKLNSHVRQHNYTVVIKLELF